MTTTLQTALAPLLIIGSFCSLGLFEYPLGQPRPYLSFLYTLTTWSFSTYASYYNYFIYLEWQRIWDYVVIIEFIAVITLTLVNYFHFKEFKMCLYELSVVDSTLEALGAPNEYQRLRNWIIRIIIGWIVYIFCYTAEFLYVEFPLPDEPTDSVTIYLTFLEFYPEFVIILSALIWGTILGYTSSRFHQVNDRLQVICSDLFENNADRRQNRCILVRQRMTGVKDCKQYIWIIM
ncbi:hypothetical protein ALC57_08642 [Trachymyrmex cornetzi]|uniref:Gustatory receptor n=1 Tax=Trachymyrmex cornetzi TaxID=471704 RepID=A0A195E239_9HYME|nr:hypothetical protein ALC57_08642 [Trachymyrmex cornetzi]